MDHKELKEPQVLLDSGHREHRELLEPPLREHQVLKVSKGLKVQRVLLAVFLI